MTNHNINPFNELDAQSAESRLAVVSSNETPDFVCDPVSEEQELPYDGAGFPGCGDGSDDLADYNQNEANDYINE